MNIDYPAKLDELILEGESILEKQWVIAITNEMCVDRARFVAWHAECLDVLRRVVDEGSSYIAALPTHYTVVHFNRAHSAMEVVNVLKKVRNGLESGFIVPEESRSPATLPILDRLFCRFSGVARQLHSRRADRPGLEIKDEYDVQYLLHALLRIWFDDVRIEEWTPSYAGRSSRVGGVVGELSGELRNVGCITFAI